MKLLSKSLQDQKAEEFRRIDQKLKIGNENDLNQEINHLMLNNHRNRIQNLPSNKKNESLLLEKKLNEIEKRIKNKRSNQKTKKFKESLEIISKQNSKNLSIQTSQLLTLNTKRT